MSDALAARSCLHCALARALRAEAPAFAARGLEIRLSRSEAVFLPASGAVIYRRLRQLLAAARRAAARGPVKLSVLDLPGKSHVEVTATVAGKDRWQILACDFPHHDPATLPAGFRETF
jgi:hypothetical protein